MKATLEVLSDQIIPSDELVTSVETEQKLCWSSLFQWNGGIAWESIPSNMGQLELDGSGCSLTVDESTNAHSVYKEIPKEYLKLPLTRLREEILDEAENVQEVSWMHATRWSYLSRRRRSLLLLSSTRKREWCNSILGFARHHQSWIPKYIAGNTAVLPAARNEPDGIPEVIHQLVKSGALVVFDANHDGFTSLQRFPKWCLYRVEVCKESQRSFDKHIKAPVLKLSFNNFSEIAQTRG